MDLGLNGKRALVMGGSAGLGRAIAQALVHEGARVVICARNEEKLQATARAIGAEAIRCDLSEAGSAAKLVEQAREKLGGLDILLTNTGGPPVGQFHLLSTEQWVQGYTDLWLSVVESIKAALPGMQQQGFGRILLLTSVAAKEPIENLTISNSLRAGLLGLANSLSREVAIHGVTVNALMPGYTLTERLAELGSSNDELASRIPAGRLGKPEELGALAAFLASEQAGYITGQAIACDGGYLKEI